MTTSEIFQKNNNHRLIKIALTQRLNEKPLTMFYDKVFSEPVNSQNLKTI